MYHGLGPTKAPAKFPDANARPHPAIARPRSEYLACLEANGAKVKIVSDSGDHKLINSLYGDRSRGDRPTKDRQVGNCLCLLILLKLGNTSVRNTVNRLKWHVAESQETKIRRVD